MSITQAELDAIETKIKELSVTSFSAGGLTINQRETLAALEEQYVWMKKQFDSSLTFGKSYIDGIDA